MLKKAHFHRVHKHIKKHARKFLIGGAAIAMMAAVPQFYSSFGFGGGSRLFITFEAPKYVLGTVNGQDGWTSTGSAGSGCAIYDHAVASSTFGFKSFGKQSLRISNAVTSGCFGDQTFSKSLINEAGEASSTSNGMSGGTRQTHFEAKFSFASVQKEQQPGMAMSISPDRGDGSRMSYLRLEDAIDGIDVFFVDVQGTDSPANFVETKVASGLSRAKTHSAKFVIDYKNGPSNDKVKIYIDGKLVHKGTTWENYYRFDPEASAEQTPRTTDDLIFRTGGTAVPANAGKGFIFDNIKLSSSKPLVKKSWGQGKHEYNTYRDDDKGDDEDAKHNDNDWDDLRDERGR